MNKKYIAISGDYRTGKTTLGLKLEKALPNSKHIALADKLKLLTAMQHPAELTHIYKPEKTTSTRQLLRKTSQFYQDIFGEDCFVQAGLVNTEKYNYVIISDVRFKNEVLYFRNLGAQFIHIGPLIHSYAFVEVYANPETIYVPARPSLSEVLKYVK